MSVAPNEIVLAKAKAAFACLNEELAYEPTTFATPFDDWNAALALSKADWLNDGFNAFAVANAELACKYAELACWLGVFAWM